MNLKKTKISPIFSNSLLPLSFAKCTLRVLRRVLSAQEASAATFERRRNGFCSFSQGLHNNNWECSLLNPSFSKAVWGKWFLCRVVSIYTAGLYFYMYIKILYIQRSVVMWKNSLLNCKWSRSDGWQLGQQGCNRNNKHIYIYYILWLILCEGDYGWFSLRQLGREQWSLFVCWTSSRPLLRPFFPPSKVQNASYYRVKGRPQALFLFP